MFLRRAVPSFFGASCRAIPVFRPCHNGGRTAPITHPHDKEYHQTNDIDLIYGFCAYIRFCLILHIGAVMPLYQHSVNHDNNINLY
jgi:hypothetical protein